MVGGERAEGGSEADSYGGAGTSLAIENQGAELAFFAAQQCVRIGGYVKQVGRVIRILLRVAVCASCASCPRHEFF